MSVQLRFALLRHSEPLLVGRVGEVIETDGNRALLSFAPHRVRFHDVDYGQVWVPMKDLELCPARL